MLYGHIDIPGKPDLANVRRLAQLPVAQIRRMQRMGIAVDLEWLKWMGSDLEARKRELYKDMSSYVPKADLERFVGESGEDLGAFNPESSAQLTELLFTRLKIGHDKALKTVKSGKRVSINRKQLEALKWRHPVIPLVLEYRQCSKLKSTYVDALPALARFHARGNDCSLCGSGHLADHWRVHTELPTTRTDTDRLASRRPNLQNCFSADTEVLTRDGWVRFDQYQKGAEVAAWNLDGIGFEKPLGYIRRAADRMVHITSQHIDLLVTPEHRCLLRQRKRGTYVVHPAFRYPHDWVQLNAGEYRQGKGVDLTNDELALMLALQADGCWAGDGLDFSFVKLRKTKRFRALADRLGLIYRETRNPQRGRSRFYISGNSNRRVLDLMCRLIGREKLFHWDLFLSLGPSQAEFVMNEVMYWDGLYRLKTSWMSKHRHNADVVSTLFTLHGRRAVVRSYISQPSGREYWAVDVTRDRDYTMTTNRSRKPLNWSDEVYCVSVPSTFILVRRNGKTMITGNCPARTEMGREIRKAFIAEPGTKLISADYSQIELRLLADRAAERNMIRIFNDGLDIHADTAMRAFGVPLEKVMSAEGKLLYRAPCKNVNFGICYGLSAPGLYDMMMLTYATAGMTVPDWLTMEWCEQFIEKWFNLYPDAHEYFDLQHWRARRYGITWCLFGGVRRIPEVQSTHEKVIAAGLRQAGNNPIQRGAAGVMKIGMARVERRFEEMRADGMWVEALLPIHDELITQVDEEWADEVKVIVESEMAKAMVDEDTKELRCRVPVLTEAKTMSRWVKS